MIGSYSTPSGLKTGTLQITQSAGSIQGIDLMPPDSGYATLTVYDTNSGDTSALIVTELVVDAGTIGINHEYFAPVAINRGIYCVLIMVPDSQNAKYIIRYNAG